MREGTGNSEGGACGACGAEAGEECRPMCIGMPGDDEYDERDTRALDLIAEMLRDPRWGVGMLEDIAELVERTGRTTANYDDERSTWGRH